MDVSTQISRCRKIYGQIPKDCSRFRECFYPGSGKNQVIIENTRDSLGCSIKLDGSCSRIESACRIGSDTSDNQGTGTSVQRSSCPSPIAGKRMNISSRAGIKIQGTRAF